MCFSMQYLTPCGKTTVESADSAIYLKDHNPEEVTAASASASATSATTLTNDRSD